MLYYVGRIGFFFLKAPTIKLFNDFTRTYIYLILETQRHKPLHVSQLKNSFPSLPNEDDQSIS